MKTKEEQNAPKEEVETLSEEMHELTEEEQKQVTGSGISAMRRRTAKKCINPECKEYEKEFPLSMELCPSCKKRLIRFKKGQSRTH